MQASRTNPAPKVSVISLSYKTAGLIAACLDSAFAQAYSDFEAIVINDDSPDTPELEKVLQLRRLQWDRSAFSGAKIGYTRKLGARFFVGRPGSLSQSKAKMIEGYWTILAGRDRETHVFLEKDSERSMGLSGLRRKFIVHRVRSWAFRGLAFQ